MRRMGRGQESGSVRCFAAVSGMCAAASATRPRGTWSGRRSPEADGGPVRVRQEGRLRVPDHRRQGVGQADSRVGVGIRWQGLLGTRPSARTSGAGGGYCRSTASVRENPKLRSAGTENPSEFAASVLERVMPRLHGSAIREALLQGRACGFRFGGRSTDEAVSFPLFSV